MWISKRITLRLVREKFPEECALNWNMGVYEKLTGKNRHEDVIAELICEEDVGEMDHRTSLKCGW